MLSGKFSDVSAGHLNHLYGGSFSKDLLGLHVEIGHVQQQCSMPASASSNEKPFKPTAYNIPAFSIVSGEDQLVHIASLAVHRTLLCSDCAGSSRAEHPVARKARAASSKIG